MNADEMANRFVAAVAAINRQDTIELEKLLAGGLDPNTKAHDGTTLLMCAADAGAVDAVRLLLHSGADVEARTDAGLSALMFAAVALSDKAVRMLLEAGADATATALSGSTALDFARDRVRRRFVFHVPLTYGFFVLRLPLWRARHAVLDTLTEASSGGRRDLRAVR